jgi:hypothetical protein
LPLTPGVHGSLQNRELPERDPLRNNTLVRGHGPGACLAPM